MHYTAKPFEFDPTRRYDQVGHYAGGKPSGFWLSVEGENCWRSWCEDEAWSLDGLKHVSEVMLSPEANILKIDSVEKLDTFSDKYGNGGDSVVDLRYIDWPKVKQEYDGIIIAPYQWERRHSLMWYYGWDCASGVIWNLSAVASVAAIDRRSENGL